MKQAITDLQKVGEKLARLKNISLVYILIMLSLNLFLIFKW